MVVAAVEMVKYSGMWLWVRWCFQCPVDKYIHNFGSLFYQLLHKALLAFTIIISVNMSNVQSCKQYDQSLLSVCAVLVKPSIRASYV
jgi:hypothetical protein